MRTEFDDTGNIPSRQHKPGTHKRVVAVITTTTIIIAAINAIIATNNIGRTLEWAMKKVKVLGVRRVPEANPGT